MSEKKDKHIPFYSTIPEDKKAEFYKGIQEKRSATIKAQKAEDEKTIEEARKIVPQIIAQQFAHELTNPGDIENWQPSPELVQTFKTLAARGRSIDFIREKYLSGIPDEYWHRFLKCLFRSQVSTVEDVGAEVMMTHRKIVRSLEIRLREIKQQIKIYREEKNTKIIPGYLLTLKKETEDSIMSHLGKKIEIFKSLGVVGEKVKNPTLHVHLSTPRPEKNEKVVAAVKKDPVLKLDELLSDFSQS